MRSDEHRWIHLLELGEKVISESKIEDQLTLSETSMQSILDADSVKVNFHPGGDGNTGHRIEIVFLSTNTDLDSKEFLKTADRYLSRIISQSQKMENSDVNARQLAATDAILRIDQNNTEPDKLYAIIARIIKDEFDLAQTSILIRANDQGHIFHLYSTDEGAGGKTVDLMQPETMIEHAAARCFQLSQIISVSGESDPSENLKGNWIAAVPLENGDDVFGSLIIRCTTPILNANQIEQNFLILSPLIAAIYQNEKLIETALQQSWISNIMLQIADTAQRTSSLEDQLSEIVRIMPLMIDIDRCAVYLRNPQNEEAIFESQFGFGDEDLPKLAMLPFTEAGQSCLQAVQRGETYYQMAGNALSTDPAETTAACCFLFPLKVHDNLYGYLLIDLREDPTLKGEGASSWFDAIQSICRQIALSIENHHLVEEKEVEAYTTTVLLQSAEAIALAASIKEALENISNLLPFFIGVDTSIIYLLNQQQRTYHLNAYQSESWKIQSKNLPVQFREGHFRGLDEALEEKFPSLYTIADIPPEDWLKINNQTIFQKQDDVYGAAPLLMVFPLHIQDEVCGFMLIREAEDALENRDKKIEILNGISRQISVAVQNVQLKNEIVDRDRMRKEFQFAQEIQRTFLPDETIEIPGYITHTVWRPARQLGGDFFDIFPLSNRRFGFVIADVSGKGMPAALYMTVARTLIHAAAKDGQSPSATLSSVNQLLVENSNEGLFVTVIYGILSLEQGDFIYSNAGHNIPILIQDKKVGWLQKGGMPLGITDQMQLQDDNIRLNPGDELILYTDGVTECHTESKMFFGEERLGNILSANMRSKNPRQNISVIDEKLLDFQGDQAPSDDVTILTIRRKII